MKVRSLSLLAVLLVVTPAFAQQAEPVAAGAPAGYELALTGATEAEPGHRLALSGIAYEVEGLAELRARAGLVVDAVLTTRDGRSQRTVQQTSATTGAEGRFEVALAIPTEPLVAPRIELTVHRAGQPGRRFSFPLSLTPDVTLGLLTDRNRYQPGERVRVWTRAQSRRTRAPLAGRAIEVQLMDAQRRVIAEQSGESGPSGAVVAELTLPENTPADVYHVRVSGAGASWGRSIEVTQRTVERMLGAIELADADAAALALVAPGSSLRGRVWARTPSGTPVRDAEIELYTGPDAESLRLTTGPDGSAPFEVRAPAWMSGEVARQTLTARIVHPAYGSITAAAPYLMARVRAVVEVTPRGGALVPEVPSTLMIAVADPRGWPLAEGTPVVVRGAGIRGGEARTALDARSLAEVSLVLPRGAASTLPSGPCANGVAAMVEVEVLTDPPVVARTCALVSPDAEVLPEVVGSPVIAPGATVEVAIARRRSVNGRPVLVEALWSGRAVAFAWVGARESRARLAIPDDLLGVVTIRARAAREPNHRAPLDEPGESAFGVGAFDALLVRPADSFRLSVTPALDRYLIRQEAEVELAASRAPAGPAWAALVVRDEAAHGGEEPWDAYFLRDQLHEAAWQPASDANARMVRVALSGTLRIDREPSRPPPLEAPPWAPRRPHRPGVQAPGVLRDPVVLREELLRRGLAPAQRALEGAVAALDADPRSRAQLVQGRAFHPDAVAHLVATGRLSPENARTLGGEPLTVRMIEAADPGFSFDTVARRVGRQRLSRLLLALARLVDPDDPNAERVSRELPPERWLGTLVQLSMVGPADLIDPWGRPFVFRRVNGRPPLVVSERALDWELASAGPDGRFGTADDLRDPFARAVPEGTPYAINSGEEELLRRFGALAPARAVLTRMSQAYDRVALAATEERRASAVDADMSESAPLGGLGGGVVERVVRGHAPPARAARARARAAPAPVQPPAEIAEVAEAEAEPADGSRIEVLATIVREDFPATLFFAGEISLDERGRAKVEVPLADALTTYRIEAIAWTASGWTTSGAGRVRVDQAALVDAPIPSFATAGDRLRLPIRVENRTDAPLPVRIGVRSEGIAIDASTPGTLEVPAGGAREATVDVQLRSVGVGSLLVAVASLDGESLDAVRRPISVLADGWTAREQRLELVDGTKVLTVDVPAEARERGPGQLTIRSGPDLFGELDEALEEDPLWAAWASAMAGRALHEQLRRVALQSLVLEADEDADDDDGYFPLPLALALGAAWSDELLSDEDARPALRAIGRDLPGPDAGDAAGESDWLLLGLAPVAMQLERRPALRADAERLLQRLRRLVSSHAASQSEAPSTWARAAAALALSGGDRARALELVRRVERHLVRVGALAWVEPEPERDEWQEPRAQATALLSLALSALERRDDALALVQGLLEMRTPRSESFVSIAGGAVPALESAAAARLSPGATEALRVTLDGVPLDTTRSGGVIHATLPGLGRPGRHELRVSADGVALVQLSFTHGMPWTAPPRRRAALEVEVDGEIGPRDARSGLHLRVQNRGPRLIARPVVELELPAGAELDEPARAALAARLRSRPQQEGRTLILPLRALPPGRTLRLPLPVRWSVGGTLHGLGAIAYDEAVPRAVSSRAHPAVEIPDEGPEPARPDLERSEAGAPPPLPILPRLTPGS